MLMSKSPRMTTNTLFTFAQLVAFILAQTSSITTMASKSSTITSSAAAPSATSRIPQIHSVAVGQGNFKFTPDTIFAAVGDVVSYSFWSSNHSVARADYKIPCIPYEDVGKDRTGFFSGFQPVGSVDDVAYWILTVNDTKPVFFYCSAIGSCLGYGMVGVINPSEEETLDVQKAYASNATIMVSPGQPMPAEGSLAPSSSPAPSATPSHGHRLPGGAIVGIVLGVVAMLVVCAALCFYVGRARSLKDVLDRKDATVAHGTPRIPGLVGSTSHGFPNGPHSEFGTTTYCSSTTDQPPPFQHHRNPMPEPPRWQTVSPNMGYGGWEDNVTRMHEVPEKVELASASDDLHFGPHELEAAEKRPTRHYDKEWI